MTKYAANAMLATRISFMNELSGLCETMGADIEQVRAGMGSDERIGRAFLFAGVGYGGSCFPKDVRALIHMGRENQAQMGIVEAVQEANLRQQERFARRVIENCRGGETVAVWGLAFKARTDDIRESPAMYCVEQFLAAGLKVRAFDPAAMSVAAAVLEGPVTMHATAYEALEGAHVLVVLTDWQEFRTPEFDVIRSTLARPVLFDGRNLYDPAWVREQGLEYHSVGRL
jgi:UDPglucose 6-dehydrogenase